MKFWIRKKSHQTQNKIVRAVEIDTKLLAQRVCEAQEKGPISLVRPETVGFEVKPDLTPWTLEDAVRLERELMKIKKHN